MEGIVTGWQLWTGFGAESYNPAFDFCGLASYFSESSPLRSSPGSSRKCSRRSLSGAAVFHYCPWWVRERPPTSFMPPRAPVFISIQLPMVAPLRSDFWLRYFLLEEQTEGTCPAYAISHVFTLNINIFFIHQAFSEPLLYVNAVSRPECSAMNNKFLFLEVLISAGQSQTVNRTKKLPGVCSDMTLRRWRGKREGR